MFKKHKHEKKTEWFQSVKALKPYPSMNEPDHWLLTYIYLTLMSQYAKSKKQTTNFQPIYGTLSSITFQLASESRCFHPLSTPLPPQRLSPGRRPHVWNFLGHSCPVNTAKSASLGQDMARSGNP